MSQLGTNPVLEFATAMQKELDDNSHKGLSWKEDSALALLNRLKEEVEEVEQAINNNKSYKKILSECADVGNIAMMIADVYEKE